MGHQYVPQPYTVMSSEAGPTTVLAIWFKVPTAPTIDTTQLDVNAGGPGFLRI